MSINKVYIETYGCQMNVADSELVMGILKNKGYRITEVAEEANVILLNTCSIRENAEVRIHGRLGNLKKLKENRADTVIGVLGCMAERLRKRLMDEQKMVDLVVGPDEYRRLPEFIDNAFTGEKGIGVKLSRTETYDDIEPFREEGISAWISIMRGCNNFCSYCVVPYTRGRERSVDLESVVADVKKLSERGFREITLLGQNVNSYNSEGNDFADLLASCAVIDRSMRIRFSTSHPKDISEKLLQTIADHENICNYIHLPVQSGSNKVLDEMKRTYTIEHYNSIIDKAKELIPNVSFSTDIIAGFPNESDEDHDATLEVIKRSRFNGAYMFKYSPREGTKAYNLEDNVSEAIKTKRLSEIIDLQHKISFENNQELIGKEQILLVEGSSKKSDQFLAGRTDSNKVAIFPYSEDAGVGSYVKVKINRATSATLFADLIEIVLPGNEKINLTA
ncbi:MAG: tRNA (N6-isopentenyl adenosine(37)-C2)-methylthiotransferase MiaB [Melioribacteraceae bacterium]|nr:tRNA (N6-isopentenyl adenosine(37)-C2)-methylthiotransferase MiaB [Melioribacteraceae bacterium]